MRADCGTLLIIESAFWPDKDSRRTLTRCRSIGERLSSTFIREIENAVRRPGSQQCSKLDRFRHIREHCSSALFRSLYHVAAKPVHVQSFDYGSSRDDRLVPRNPQLTGLFRNQINARLLDRRRQQPDIGHSFPRP